MVTLFRDRYRLIEQYNIILGVEELTMTIRRAKKTIVHLSVQIIMLMNVFLTLSYTWDIQDLTLKIQINLY